MRGAASNGRPYRDYPTPRCPRTAAPPCPNSAALNNTAIACFEDKYYWKFWRPVTAIHEAASDGNPTTAPDPNWTPLVDTPNHPDHPSGHACASGAIASTLQHFFHTDEIAFSADSFLSGTTRSFSRLSQALEEIEGARVWAGIHFRTANTQGQRLGRQVAHWLRDHYFRRWH